jgi:hypothetical protein
MEDNDEEEQGEVFGQTFGPAAHKLGMRLTALKVHPIILKQNCDCNSWFLLHQALPFRT